MNANSEAKLVMETGEALQWALCHPVLRDVVVSGAKVWPALSMFLVSIYRPQDANNSGRSGIHSAGPPYRAVDGSGRNLANSTDACWEACGLVAEKVNALWVYDPDRPSYVVAVGKKHGTGPHVHFQVHPNTVRVQG